MPKSTCVASPCKTEQANKAIHVNQKCINCWKCTCEQVLQCYYVIAPSLHVLVLFLSLTNAKSITKDTSHIYLPSLLSFYILWALLGLHITQVYSIQQKFASILIQADFIRQSCYYLMELSCDEGANYTNGILYMTPY